MTNEAFIEAYIKAHYYRPDGLDRKYPEYHDPEHINKVTAIMEKHGAITARFQISYNPLDEYRVFAEITLVSVLPISNDDIFAIVDLSGGECAPMVDYYRSIQYKDHILNITLREVY